MFEVSLNTKKQIVMKNLLHFTLAIFIAVFSFSNHSLAQNSVWVTLKNSNEIKIENVDGGIRTNHPTMNRIVEDFSVTNIQKAVPASKQAKLQSVYQIDCDCNANNLMAALNRYPNVFQTPEMAPQYTPLYVPNDYTEAFNSDYALDLINATDAWDVTQGDSSTHIGISDIGFVYNHEELEDKIAFIDPDITPYSYHHGTAVSIAAAGHTDNNVGKSAIGNKCMLELYPMSYNGILSATYNGVKVINVSWMASCYYSTYGQDIIDEVYDNGSIIIAAAGNGSASCNGPDTHVYPASFNHVISVTSIGPNDNHERQIGDPSSTHQHNDSVDISAPGYDVALSLNPGSYITGNGTSFASPMVAGTVGLMISVNPCLNFEDVEAILKSTAVNIDSLNPDYAGQIGAGRLNAHAAVLAASQYQKLNPTILQSFNCQNWEYKLIADTDASTNVASVVWMDSVNSSQFFAGNSGLHYVKVTDVNGCFGMDSITVSVPDTMNVTGVVNNQVCHNDGTGSILTNVSGGQSPYAMQWNNGGTSQDLFSLEAGAYTLEITDDNNCTVTKNFTVTTPNTINVTFQTVAANSGQQDGSIDLEVSGGTPGYSFAWSDSAFTEDRTNINSGNYAVTITDQNSCTYYQEITVDEDESALSVTTANTTLKVYPNPVINSFKIESNVSFNNFELYNAAGQIVRKNQTFNNQRINITDLTSGYYVLKVFNDNQIVHTQKLIKQ